MSPEVKRSRETAAAYKNRGRVLHRSRTNRAQRRHPQPLPMPDEDCTDKEWQDYQASIIAAARARESWGEFTEELGRALREAPRGRCRLKLKAAA